LFGHEKGAFTGAARTRRGLFELAHTGTVFLDEIGEMPYHLQVKLLRVLQDREVRPVGGERTISVDVRVMAASNRDLEAEVAEGNFRRDLFYRLSVVTLTVPPLRERREDIPELVDSYLDYLQPRVGCDVEGITEEAVAALVAYAWPGNVRELINVIERALLLCDGRQVTPGDLPQTIRGGAAGEAPRRSAPGAAAGRLPDEWLGMPWKETRQAALAEVERAYFAALLEETGGRVGETAERAGISPRSLYEKMKRHGLRKEDFRS
jgi:DNA-binding NtrC family response regulator